jgi:hypothetical protein
MVIPNTMLWMQKNAYEPTTIKKTAKQTEKPASRSQLKGGKSDDVMLSRKPKEGFCLSDISLGDDDLRETE